MENEIVNRVNNSGVNQINLDDLYPTEERVVFDIKNCLYQELVIVEKSFRNIIAKTDWKEYENKFVAITCTVDAIVPLWAYMLISSKLKPYAKKVVLGNLIDLEKVVFYEIINQLDFSIYQNKNVIVKGCGKFSIPESVFVEFTSRLQEYAKTIMYGEACSAVPLYKR